MTGRSRAQVTRLIGQFTEQGDVKVKRARRHRFRTRYSTADIGLLALVDEAHDTLSGPATVKILYRGFHEFADVRYERLSSISAAHIYNLRKRREYRERRMNFTKTRPTPVSIGERRKPEPEGRPGYLRIDTVHQGDLDGVKGVYHINAVDEVTQWQVIGATEKISEAWLKPVLEAILEQFPFQIRGFHSDNGSEFINHTVAAMLNKLLIEQTKSRPRHSNDNGLVESKNGAVIRKHMGFDHIAFGSRRGHQKLLQGLFQSVSELSPALRRSRAEERQEGQNQANLQLVRHTVGDTASTARAGRMPEGRRHRRTSGAGRRGRERHRCRPEDAGSKTETIRHVRGAENRMKNGLRKCRTVGQRGKPKAGFPSLPTSP